MHRPVPARRSRLRRVKASLLLAVFLSAGTSLPSLDGLLFHRGAAAERAQTHVEPAGICHEHAAHCVLGRTASGSGAHATPGPEVKFELPRRPVHPLAAHSLFSAAPTDLPNSRAPPVLLA